MNKSEMFDLASKELAMLTAEIERLRAALKGITLMSAESLYDAERMKIAARRALKAEADEQREDTK